MKRKVIAIIIGIVCVIVAAVCLNQFVFSTKVTYIKDADNHKVQKAYDLLANAYLDDGEKQRFTIQTLLRQIKKSVREIIRRF